MHSTPTMIFHAPYPMEPNPTAASRLRPLRMRQAFAEIGYHVIDMSGTTLERRRKLAALRRKLRQGTKPEFLYSENSTQPNVFATSVKSGFAPMLDNAILSLVHRHGIPSGVFYRDIYWKFAHAPAKTVIGKLSPFFHRLDMRGYLRNNVHFFLPSEGMATYLNLPNDAMFSALPPAGDSGRTMPLPTGPLRLFYVGGLGGHYRLDALFAALKQEPSIELELVTRPEQWKAALAQDSSLGSDQIHVHHLNSSELDPLYADTHIGILAVEPSDYRKFAVPAKLFEYISRGRPVLVTAGTEAARIVNKLDAGWQVNYGIADIAQILTFLKAHPEDVKQKARNARIAAQTNTWRDRARSVAEVLTESK